jgi:hypothetical protein
MKTVKTTPKAASKRLLKPAITLRPDVKQIDAGETITVDVGLKAIDAVELRLEPAKTFSLDTKSMKKSGKVHLKGKRDGIATLIARGGGVEKMIHLRCVGPTVRILAFGYWVRD